MQRELNDETKFNTPKIQSLQPIFLFSCNYSDWVGANKIINNVGVPLPYDYDKVDCFR